MPRSRLARNIVANLGGQLLLLVLGLIAARLVFSRLGQDALGLVLFVQTVNLVLAGVLDLGISAITVREVAAHLDDDPTYVSDLVRTASSFYWGGFTVVAILIVLTAPWVATHWIHLQAMNAASATAVLRLLGVAAMTALPRALYTSLFRGMQRMAFNNGIDVGIGFLQQLGTVVILARGGDLFAVTFWLAATYALGILAYIGLLARIIPPIALVPGWSTGVIQRNARFSGHLMSISALATVHTYVDKLVVSKLLAVATLGWYALATSVAARGALVAGAIGDAAYPLMSRLFQSKDRAAMLAHYRTLQDLVGFATFPLYAGLVFAALPLFSALFGAGVAHSLLFPVSVLALGYFMNGTLVMPYVYSLAVGKPEITSRLSLAAVFIVVPVTVLAVASFGVAGASLGYLSYHVFFYALAVPRYCHECLLRPAAEWYGQAAKVMGTGALTYGPAWVVAWRVGGLSTVALVIGFLAASVAFAASATRLCEPGLRRAGMHLTRLDRSRTAAGEAA
jgi:O-antigen/teichoic acid export membrane protein